MMITYEDILVAIRQMSNEERQTLMKALVHSLAAEWQPKQVGASSLERVRGMLKSEDEKTLSERELRDDHTAYLIEKYDIRLLIRGEQLCAYVSF
jgi:hypothetical protein